MATINSWTVDDVASWVESIDMGHKANIFKEVDGKQLLAASSDDLKAMGLTNLQSKKILKSIDTERKKIKATETTTELSSSNNNLSEENGFLKKELRDL
jgi:hypothetical protein